MYVSVHVNSLQSPSFCVYKQNPVTWAKNPSAQMNPYRDYTRTWCWGLSLSVPKADLLVPREDRTSHPHPQFLRNLLSIKGIGSCWLYVSRMIHWLQVSVIKCWLMLRPDLDCQEDRTLCSQVSMQVACYGTLVTGLSSCQVERRRGAGTCMVTSEWRRG